MHQGHGLPQLMMVLVLQLAAILISTRLIGHLAQRYLRQPRVLGELVAGMLIGPFALGGIPIAALGRPLFSIAEGVIPISPELYGFSVVASIVLLFLAGLETDLPTFLRFSGQGSVVGLGGVVVSFAVGAWVAILLLPGVDSLLHPSALFLGVLATATSVGITARILSERRKMATPEAVTILSAAVLDDVIGIILLAIVVGIVQTEAAGTAVDWGSIGWVALKAFGFWIVSTLIGILVAPRLTRGLKAFQSMEITSGVTFGIALFLAGLSEMAGLAMIIGAYVAGLSLSRTDVAHELQERMSGLYDFMVPVFFAVMGMMVDFRALGGVLVVGVIYAAAVIAAKVIGAGVPALLSGFNLRGALRIGAGMLPRGEVSLIIAGIGLSSGAIGPDLFGVAVLTMLLSTLVAPPILVRSFSGGPGYQRERAQPETAGLVQLGLDFPSRLSADFFRQRLLRDFRDEEFFTYRVDHDKTLYHIRKDEIQITLMQDGGAIRVSTAARHEQFVRLMMAEEILELKELLDSLKTMTEPDSMGQNLLGGMIDE